MKDIVRALRMALLRLWNWRRWDATYISIIGGPGAGKGTQAAMLSQALSIPHLSMGNVFRKEMAANTPLGQQVRSYVDSGRLVPDEVWLAALARELRRPEYNVGAIIDGSPRTLAQAKMLDELLAQWGRTFEAVLLLEVPEEDLIERLSNRRTCTNSDCGQTYHLKMAPPREADKCDACGQALYQRNDDKPDRIRTRLAIFNAESEPICDHYDQLERLWAIQSTNLKTPSQVFDEVLWAVNG